MIYGMKRFDGEGGSLVAHLCQPGREDAVEIQSSEGQWVVLSREQFREFTSLIEGQFEALATNRKPARVN
jgi:hypothetical protein